VRSSTGRRNESFPLDLSPMSRSRNAMRASFPGLAGISLA